MWWVVWEICCDLWRCCWFWVFVVILDCLVYWWCRWVVFVVLCGFGWLFLCLLVDVWDGVMLCWLMWLSWVLVGVVFCVVGFWVVDEEFVFGIVWGSVIWSLRVGGFLDCCWFVWVCVWEDFCCCVWCWRFWVWVLGWVGDGCGSDLEFGWGEGFFCFWIV